MSGLRKVWKSVKKTFSRNKKTGSKLISAAPSDTDLNDNQQGIEVGCPATITPTTSQSIDAAQNPTTSSDTETLVPSPPGTIRSSPVASQKSGSHDISNYPPKPVPADSLHTNQQPGTSTSTTGEPVSPHVHQQNNQQNYQPAGAGESVLQKILTKLEGMEKSIQKFDEKIEEVNNKVDENSRETKETLENISKTPKPGHNNETGSISLVAQSTPNIYKVTTPDETVEVHDNTEKEFKYTSGDRTFTLERPTSQTANSSAEEREQDPPGNAENPVTDQRDEQ